MTGRKTPSDTTEFDREQLRFFLAQENVGGKLAELNPSLAWLPELVRMKIVQPVNLAPWIERNFDDPEAVRQVCANLSFFDEGVADYLEFSLARKRDALSKVLVKSWNLLIRHIRNSPRGMLRSEWYEIAPRLKAGEYSAELIEKFSQALRPQPKISKKIAWGYDESDEVPTLTRPSDLMAIDFEVDDGVSEAEAIEALPVEASLEVYQRFLINLTHDLDGALADAQEAEVEGNVGYSISDTDVPSVAAHPQNEHHRGFLPIVRVIAEVWTRLAEKDAERALPYVQRWSTSDFKLDNRLALFAAANGSVPSNEAALVLVTVPQGFLFLTAASVEVFRLIRSRWSDFSDPDKRAIEQRILAGPPVDWFKTDADIQKHLDRSRFDILGEMARRNLQLGEDAKRCLEDLQIRYSDWQLRAHEQAGFHVWHGSVGFVSGDSEKFRDVPTESLVDEAQKASRQFDGDADWRALCQTDPLRALQGLKAKADLNEWPKWAWSSFLWAAQSLDNPSGLRLAGNLILEMPEGELARIVDGAAWWLNEKAKVLDEDVLWKLWDRIVAVAKREGGHA